MRTTFALAALAPVALAAPTPSLFGSDLLAAVDATVSKIITTTVSDVSALASAVSKLGTTLATNAASHGAVWNYQSITPSTNKTISKIAHSIKWPASTSYINWSTYKANGVNLGAWLEQEKNYDPNWWNSLSSTAADEWTLCEDLGSKCGPALEARYASFITTDTIDKFAAKGINTLRIPTTYAAWIQYPGSQLYHGNQQTYLKKISTYAIEKYGMHVIIGLHSLPGGVNSLGIGEAFGHDAWFQNVTNLDYSFQAIDAILKFIVASGVPYGYTIAPINEASDNFAGFATATGLTEAGSDWIVTYTQGVLNRVAKVNSKIPVMLQDCFLGESYWSPLFNSSANLVIDSHIYFFAASGIYADYVAGAICGQSEYSAGDAKFPVFIGEWSLQTLYNNTLADRRTIYETQVYAYQKYNSGGAFWNAKMVNNTDAVSSGEGTLSDYWSFDGLIDAGVVTGNITQSYC